MNNLYKFTVSSHGRNIEIIAKAKSMQDAIEDFKQANRNAYRIHTKNEEIATEGEILKCELLTQLYAGFKGIYYM